MLYLIDNTLIIRADKIDLLTNNNNNKQEKTILVLKHESKK